MQGFTRQNLTRLDKSINGFTRWATIWLVPQIQEFTRQNQIRWAYAPTVLHMKQNRAGFKDAMTPPLKPNLVPTNDRRIYPSNDTPAGCKGASFTPCKQTRLV